MIAGSEPIRLQLGFVEILQLHLQLCLLTYPGFIESSPSQRGRPTKPASIQFRTGTATEGMAKTSSAGQRGGHWMGERKWRRPGDDIGQEKTTASLQRAPLRREVTLHLMLSSGGNGADKVWTAAGSRNSSPPPRRCRVRPNAAYLGSTPEHDHHRGLSAHDHSQVPPPSNSRRQPLLLVLAALLRGDRGWHWEEPSSWTSTDW